MPLRNRKARPESPSWSEEMARTTGLEPATKAEAIPTYTPMVRELIAQGRKTPRSVLPLCLPFWITKCPVCAR